MPDGMAMGVVHHDQVVAVVMFTNYDIRSGVIEVSAASDTPRWLTRPVLWEIYDYSFNQLGCQSAVQRIDPDNLPLARMLTRYGFKRYDIPRLRGRNKGEAIFVLHDDVWLANGFHKENANGQKCAKANAAA